MRGDSGDGFPTGPFVENRNGAGRCWQDKAADTASTASVKKTSALSAELKVESNTVFTIQLSPDVGKNKVKKVRLIALVPWAQLRVVFEPQYLKGAGLGLHRG